MPAKSSTNADMSTYTALTETDAKPSPDGRFQPFHGHACKRKRTPEYGSWLSMRRRCLEPRHKAFARYGGRGITVCERWLNSFSEFLSDMGPRPLGTTLDRIIGTGNYEPGNCRRATPLKQARNSTWIKPLPSGRTIPEISRETGLSLKTLYQRHEKGIPEDEMISVPTRPQFKFTNEQVLAIGRRISNGEKVTHIAREFRVAHSSISKIKLGKRRPVFAELVAAVTHEFPAIQPDGPKWIEIPTDYSETRGMEL